MPAHNTYPHPPRWADKLLAWLCPPELLEEMQGDLHELYCERVQELGGKRARRQYVFDVIGFMRPYFLKRRPHPYSKTLHTDMLRNYFTVAFRNLVRYKAFSFINIFGLAVGMACSVLILLWVQDELSYDRFHRHAERLYRIRVEMGDHKTSVSCAPMGPAVLASLPEVEQAARLSATGNLFEANGHTFEESNGFCTDADFLTLFSFPLLEGDARTALARRDGVVLSEKLAEKYFGRQGALGRTVKLDNEHVFTVTGVVQVPHNSHIQFNYLLPLSFQQAFKRNSTSWTNFEYFTYLRLKESVAPEPATLSKITRHLNSIYVRNEQGLKAAFDLQPLTEIYLTTDLAPDMPWHGSIGYIRIFSVAAICILLVACINFMNLSTARAARRAKEVGLRKVTGANRSQLIGQFMGEAVLMSVLALVVALGLVWLVLPVFNATAGKQLSLQLPDLRTAVWLAGITLLTGLLSGSYPALFLSAFAPIGVLKGGVKYGSRSLLFRSGLVVAQFVVSVVLLIGTAIVYHQLQYIKTRNLGFDKENLVYVPMRGDLWKKEQTLRTHLAQHTLTRTFSIVSELPANIVGGVGVNWEGKDPQQQAMFAAMNVDENFLQTFGVRMVSGRWFSRELKSDSAGYIVNEAALGAMGMNAASALGKSFDDGRIIGVVKNFNFKPLHHGIEPLVMRLNDARGVLVVRTQPYTAEATVKILSQLFRSLQPAYPFTYNFVDQDIADLYKTEQRIGKISRAFAGLAIFVSCLGLYGLAAFAVEQRRKEIGIRKVLGATVANLVTMLSGSFLRLVLLSILIASPLAWYIMRGWLEGFAYRINVSGWVFAATGTVALLVALLTVGFQSLKASLADPARSLRSE